MSYIIGSPCVSTCDTACVDVCPVDCIHGPIDIDGMGMEVKNMSKDEIIGKQLYINPAECIDCGMCLSCPVDAIYTDEDEAIAAEGIGIVNKNYNFFNLNYEQ